MSHETPAPAEVPTGDSLADLVHGHRELHRELADELAALDPAVFFAPQGEFWSPAQHLDHLNRSVRPLVGALRLPRALLRLRFGWPRRASRPPAEVVELYLAKLAAGGRASGRYVPEVTPAAPGADAPDAARAAQERLLYWWRRLGDRLGGVLCLWPEDRLDKYCLPHPLLGRMTVREMVAWSLYHGRHHRLRIRERRKA